MPNRNGVLTEHRSELGDRLAQSGRHQNASEGLRLIKDRDENAKLKALRDTVQLGIDDREAGRYETFKTAEALDKHVKSLVREGYNRRFAKPRGT
jgi:antitoxin ParD1/3/4